MLIILQKIWVFITSKAGEWLGIGAAILGALAIVQKSGADSVRSSELKKTLKEVRIKDEIDARIDGMSDADAINELRNKWRQ